MILFSIVPIPALPDSIMTVSVYQWEAETKSSVMTWCDIIHIVALAVSSYFTDTGMHISRPPHRLHPFLANFQPQVWKFNQKEPHLEIYWFSLSEYGPVKLYKLWIFPDWTWLLCGCIVYILYRTQYNVLPYFHRLFISSNEPTSRPSLTQFYGILGKLKLGRACGGWRDLRWFN